MPSREFWRSRSGEEVIQLAIRLSLLAGLILWCFVLVRPFIPIIAWGVVLAVALYRPYRLLSQFLGDRPNLAAAIITLVAIAILIGPVTWLGLGLVEGAKSLADKLISEKLTLPSPPDRVKDWPLIGDRLFDLWTQASNNLEAALTQLAPHLTPLVRPMLAIAGGVGVSMLKFFASVILAGFLFPAGPRLVAAGRNVVTRLIPDHGEDFIALAGATIRTVSLGVIGVAILQSFLFGIGLRFGGIKSAGVLAFVVMILSILQLGPAIILVPSIIWIWMTNDFGTALVVTIYLVLVGLADNVLKPLLMGRGLTTPLLVIFVGLLGGTLAHGLVGLFIGPVVLAVGWEVMRAWVRGPEAAPAEERIAAEA